MNKYKTVFFDLDHTLWDYDTNSHETLNELFEHHNIRQIPNVTFQRFHDAFQQVNLKLWDLYDRELIGRDVIRNERFKMVLSELGSKDDTLSHQLSEHYVVLSPTKTNLILNALDVLDYLKARYPLYVVTNGFETMQTTKVNSGGIRHYFQDVITSERAGHKKPAREIFDYTLALGGFKKEEAIMIGDNILTDIAGATNAGIDSVLFNPKSQDLKSTFKFVITDLIELKSIL